MYAFYHCYCKTSWGLEVALLVWFLVWLVGGFVCLFACLLIMTSTVKSTPNGKIWHLLDGVEALWPRCCGEGSAL